MPADQCLCMKDERESERALPLNVIPCSCTDSDVCADLYESMCRFSMRMSANGRKRNKMTSSSSSWPSFFAEKH